MRTSFDRTARRSRRIAILVLCALFLLPLAFMLLGSLRPPGLPPPDGFEVWPQDPRWDNYRSVFGFVDLTTHIRNSLLVVAVAVPLTVVIASWAGFAIATATPERRRNLVVVSLLALMVPLSALWVPRFVIYEWSGLLGGLAPLMAPALMATSPFYVLIFALAYSRIPSQLYEAARIEGLTPLQIWRRVAFPLAKPAAFAVGVLAFAFHWSNFVDALLYVGRSTWFTLPLGLRALQTLEPTNHPILLAGAVLATVPVAVAFFLAQRSFFVKTLGVR